MGRLDRDGHVSSPSRPGLGVGIATRAAKKVAVEVL